VVPAGRVVRTEDRHDTPVHDKGEMGGRCRVPSRRGVEAVADDRDGLPSWRSDSLGARLARREARAVGVAEDVEGEVEAVQATVDRRGEPRRRGEVRSRGAGGDLEAAAGSQDGATRGRTRYRARRTDSGGERRAEACVREEPPRMRAPGGAPRNMSQHRDLRLPTDACWASTVAEPPRWTR
jgi:hypothetical protein